MTTHHLIAAVQNLDSAIDMTFEPDEKGKLKSINRRLRRMLRKKGVFVGGQQPERKETKCPATH